MHRRTAVTVLLASLPLLACAGRLEEPERFVAGACPPDTTPEVILQQTCATGGCHTGSDPAGSLDLASPGVAERLLGGASARCDGQPYVMPNGQGYFFHKMSAEQPRCGMQMPMGARPLSTAELACLRGWLMTAAGEVAP